jgi:tripartite-type tricarboxylate transporter receptor subunit TctC
MAFPRRQRATPMGATIGDCAVGRRPMLAVVRGVITLRLASAAFAGLLLTVTVQSGKCGEYPLRPVRLLVASSAGSPPDIAARLAAEALSRALDKPVFVENRSGGGGLVATEGYLTGEVDGYTILVAAPGPFAIMPALKRVSYDVARDFVAIGTIWRSAAVLAVPSASPIRTLADFVAQAQAHPASMTVGSAGTGTMTHLIIELLKHEAAINVIHVPFRGSGEALSALIAGQLDAMFGDVQIVAPQVESGTVRALAVAAARPVPFLPNVPTTGDCGFPRVIGENWFGLVVSAKTPPAIIERLRKALAAAREDPAYQQKLAGQHASSGEPGPEALENLIRNDAAKWHAIVDASRIKLN